MLLALLDGERVPPAGTGDRGACPRCGVAVIAKAGPLVTWHWAHHAAAATTTPAAPAMRATSAQPSARARRGADQCQT